MAEVLEKSPTDDFAVVKDAGAGNAAYADEAEDMLPRVEARVHFSSARVAAETMSSSSSSGRAYTDVLDPTTATPSGCTSSLFTFAL